MDRRRRYLGVVAAVGVAAAVAAVGGVSATNSQPNVTGTNAAEKVHGNARENILRGLGGADDMFGYEANDTIYGDDGNDTLYGHAGNDTMHGGAHNDTVHGNEGSDVVNGNDGNDWVYGGPGNDEVYGGEGSDYLFTGDGTNVARGGGGADSITSEGRDTVYGDDGNDVFDFMKSTSGTSAFGGAGDDLFGAATVPYGDPSISIDCGPGNDTAYVTPNDTTTGCEKVVLIGDNGKAPTIAVLTAPLASSAPAVTAHVTASDPDNDITHVRYTTFGLGWSDWQAFTPTFSIPLSDGLGAKAVIAQVKDSKNRESNVAVAAVTRTAPPVISEVSVPVKSSDASVVVKIKASDADSTITQMRVTVFGQPWSDWKAFATKTSVTLPSGLGTKVVVVQVKDANGGESNVGSANVERVNPSSTWPSKGDDINKGGSGSSGGSSGGTSAQTPPSGGSAVARDRSKPRVISMRIPSKTCKRGIVMRLHAMDNRKVKKMRIAVKGSKFGAWRAYKARSTVTLPKGIGTKTVRVQVRDAAGNVSAKSLRRTKFVKSCGS